MHIVLFCFLSLTYTLSVSRLLSTYSDWRVSISTWQDINLQPVMWAIISLSTYIFSSPSVCHPSWLCSSLSPVLPPPQQLSSCYSTVSHLIDMQSTHTHKHQLMPTHTHLSLFYSSSDWQSITKVCEGKREWRGDEGKRVTLGEPYWANNWKREVGEDEEKTYYFTPTWGNSGTDKRKEVVHLLPFLLVCYDYCKHYFLCTGMTPLFLLMNDLFESSRQQENRSNFLVRILKGNEK